MGEKVLATIITEMKTAKYVCISVDTTPEIMHVDQLTFNTRYVLDSGPIERFLQYIPMFSHTGAEISNP